MDLAGKYKAERKEVARFMRRLYTQGLTTTSGGNISLRMAGDLIALTPSATDKGTMRWREVGIMNIMGENLTPELRPTMEAEMHLSIYRRNMEVSAIVHAHPVCASAFTAMKLRINTSLTAESRAILGEPVMVPYALMGTKELAYNVADKAEQYDILLLENHGILTTGTTLLQAFNKIEVLENAARMTLIVEMTRNKSQLTRERLQLIDKFFR